MADAAMATDEFTVALYTNNDEYVGHGWEFADGDPCWSGLSDDRETVFVWPTREEAVAVGERIVAQFGGSFVVQR